MQEGTHLYIDGRAEAGEPEQAALQQRSGAPHEAHAEQHGPDHSQPRG